MCEDAKMGKTIRWFQGLRIIMRTCLTPQINWGQQVKTKPLGYWGGGFNITPGLNDNHCLLACSPGTSAAGLQKRPFNAVARRGMSSLPPADQVSGAS